MRDGQNLSTELVNGCWWAVLLTVVFMIFGADILHGAIDALRWIGFR